VTTSEVLDASRRHSDLHDGGVFSAIAWPM
jgi:hypothetical protein